MAKKNFIKELEKREYTRKLASLEFKFKSGAPVTVQIGGIPSLFTNRGCPSPDDVVSIATISSGNDTLETLSIEETMEVVDEIKEGVRQIRMTDLKHYIKLEEKLANETEENDEKKLEQMKDRIKNTKKRNKDNLLRMKKDLIALEKEQE